MTLTQFIIICPLVFVAGIIDAVGGGGGLVSFPAYLIAGLPVHNAIATNKLSSCMGTAIATLRYSRMGYAKLKISLMCIPTALLGSWLGAHLALLVEDRIFRILMLVILPLTAFYVLKTKNLSVRKEPFSEKKTILLAMIIAFFIGIYDGFYGPGTGTFLILLLTAVAHMDLREANGVTKVINLSTNVAGVAVYLANGKTMVLLGLVAGLFSIAGNYIGTNFFEKEGDKIVKPVMIVVIGIFFLKTIIELIG